MATELDLIQDEALVDLIKAAQALIKKDKRLKGYSFILFVNDNPNYEKVTRGLRLKPIGNDSMNYQMLDQYCPSGCGCRLKTDGNYIWCSGTFCDYIGKEETF